MNEKTRLEPAVTHTQQRSQELYDPRQGAEAFRLQSLSLAPQVFEPPRTNYFTVLSIDTGDGEFWADTAQYEFCEHQLLFFVPYQYIRLVPRQPVQATMLHFHANFLCVETFHAETGCSGKLFNDPYGLPVVALDDDARKSVHELLVRMSREQEEQHAAWQDVLLAAMKILLVVASRLKQSQTDSCPVDIADYRHPVMGQLRELIEQNYRVLHAPADYATLLHMTPKTLGRHVREFLGKTLTDLIRERILTHAKWELLHTLRSVKEIAAEIGFHDELYFSRLFKKATGVSPTFFREFETEIRGGSNLSM